MTDIPDMKVKAVVTFPAQVNGGIGIGVARDGGTFTFDLNYSELASVSSIPVPAAATTFLVIWESTSGTYNRISLVNLKAALASIP